MGLCITGGVRRTEQISRTLIIDLKIILRLDSDNVNYNLMGTVIDREVVGPQNIGYARLNLSSDVEVSPMLITATNTGEQCIRLTNKKRGRSMLLAVRDIDKIKLTETRRFTLTP